MWPLNYENLKKFHISVGTGLLVAAFLLLLSNHWAMYDRFDTLLAPEDLMELALNENISSNSYNKLIEIENNRLLEKTELFGNIIESTLKVSKGLFYLGLIIFLIGYIPWVWIETKSYIIRKK